MIFLNSASSGAALVFYLPGVCTHRHRWKIEKGKSPEYFKIFEKNTIFNEHPVCLYIFKLLNSKYIHSSFLTKQITRQRPWNWDRRRRAGRRHWIILLWLLFMRLVYIPPEASHDEPNQKNCLSRQTSFIKRTAFMHCDQRKTVHNLLLHFLGE